MHRHLYVLLLLSTFFLHTPAALAAGPDCSRPLTLALHDHGLLYSPATDTGIDKDIADELIRRSGCKITVTLIQRARIWQLIESGALDFSLSGITNEARDKFAGFAWYFSNKYYLLVRRDANINALEDFAGNPALRLGVIRGFRYSTSANELVDQLSEAQRVTYSSGLDPLYALLQANRIQGMIIEPFDYPAVENNKIRAISNTLEFGDDAVPHGLIMSKKTLSAEEQEKWRQLMRAMRADGTVQRIFEKYFSPELARTLSNFRN
jgi:polar amino acid transport system substrate-binding protein